MGTMTTKNEEDTIPPPTNNLVTPLLTDLYQITMSYGYWKANKQNDKAVFELFFRKNPFKGSFTVFCGIDEVLSFVHHFKFTDDDIAYLKSTPSLSHCEDEFFTYLSNLDCSEVRIQSQTQGNIAFPKVPLITISGPLAICQLLETTLLNLVNFPSLIATNAARMVIGAKGQQGTKEIFGKVPLCVEYGLRRAQSPDGGYSASKYCMVGGFDGTANVQAGKLLGIPILGTHAHAYVQSFARLDEVKDSKMKVKDGQGESVKLLPLVLKYREDLGGDWLKTNNGELAAYVSYAAAFPNSFLSLVDTYSTLTSGIKNFILVAKILNDYGYKPVGIRLDSGDLAALSLECRKVFESVANEQNLPFLKDVHVFASSDINEATIRAMNKAGHGITGFGIGTNLVTCQAQPALGCVFKLVELNGEPRIKLSQDAGKVLIPGEKGAYRLFDDKDMPQMDVLVDVNYDTIPEAGMESIMYEPFGKTPVTFTPSRVETLLNVVWDKNRGVTREIPTIMKSRENCMSQIKNLHPSMFAEDNPMKYNVYVSKKLRDSLHDLMGSMRSS